MYEIQWSQDYDTYLTFKRADVVYTDSQITITITGYRLIAEHHLRHFEKRWADDFGNKTVHFVIINNHPALRRHVAPNDLGQIVAI